MTKLFLPLVLVGLALSQVLPMGPGLKVISAPSGPVFVRGACDNFGASTGGTTASLGNFSGANFVGSGLAYYIPGYATLGAVSGNNSIGNGTILDHQNGPNSTGVETYYWGNVAPGAAQTFSMTSGMATFPAICSLGFSGMNTAPYDMGTSVKAMSGSPYDSCVLTITPSSSTPRVLIIWANYEGTATVSSDSGFSTPIKIDQGGGSGGGYGAASAYLIQASGAPVTVTLTFSTATYPACVGAAFKT